MPATFIMLLLQIASHIIRTIIYANQQTLKSNSAWLPSNTLSLKHINPNNEIPYHKFSFQLSKLMWFVEEDIHLEQKLNKKTEESYAISTNFVRLNTRGSVGDCNSEIETLHSAFTKATIASLFNLWL